MYALGEFLRERYHDFLGDNLNLDVGNKLI